MIDFHRQVLNPQVFETHHVPLSEDGAEPLATVT